MNSISGKSGNVKLEIGDRVFARTSRGWWPGEVVDYSQHLGKYMIALDKLRTKLGNTKHWPSEAKYCSQRRWLREVLTEPVASSVRLDERDVRGEGE